MSAHTPGPWKVDNHQDANHAVINPRVGNWIAVLQQNGERTLMEQEANARLIAAAPDLLSLLVDLRSALGHVGFGTDSEPVNGAETVDLLNAWLPRINETIAAARG